MAKTKEKAIAGRTSGLIESGETVTWVAVHFGFRQQLTSKITAFNRPYYFVDEQVKGVFKSIFHEHEFEENNDHVIMKDRFHFESPMGIVGRIVNQIILTNYLTRFLSDRNQIIKQYAETDKWKAVLLN